MKTQARIVDTFEGERMKVEIHEDQVPSFEGRIALSLLERWGMVMAEDGGEDSAGRAKLALMPPEQIAVRACETAEAIVRQFDQRGWLINCPDPEAEREARRAKKATVNRAEKNSA